MTEQTIAGRTTGLNIERIYQTAVPAEDVAKTLAEHFRGQDFEAQVFSSAGDRVAGHRRAHQRRHLTAPLSGPVRGSPGKALFPRAA